jgi:alpha-L-rhamnosidase
MDWFYGDLAGIQWDADSTGFKKIVIKPTPVGNITWATAAYDCPYGRIKTAWKLDDRKFMLDVTIPPGTTANVYLPCDNKAPVIESDSDVAQTKSVKAGRWDGDCMQLEIASGEYHFQSTVSSRQPPMVIH